MQNTVTQQKQRPVADFFRSVNLTGISWLLLKRLLSSLLLILALIFFVAMCMNLAAIGGAANLLAAIPESVKFTGMYLQNLFTQDSVLQTVDLGTITFRSVGLLTAALLLATVIGLPLGGLAAIWRHRRRSRLVLVLSLVGISTPSFLAAMLIMWLNVWLGRKFGVALLPVFGFGWDLHMIMPTLVLAAVPIVNITRLGYNALYDVLEADYIRTAHAKGLEPRDIFNRHVLRNAGVQLLTTIGVSIRFSLASLPIVEFIFSWRGIGLTLLQGIQQGEVTVSVTSILPLAVLFILVNITLEVLYTLIDPRIRLGAGGVA